MKSQMCPNCGCIAHIPERLEAHVKVQNSCEMCGSGTYLYDGEVEPLTFPEENSDSKGGPEKDPEQSES